MDEMNAAKQLAPGTLVDQRFEILSFLGKGSTGQVYKARNILTSEEVAIKILTPALAKDATALERFFREAKLASQLNHPGIVSVKAFGKSTNGIIYMVQEFLNGQTLSQLIDSQKRITPGKAKQLFLLLTDALSYAHSQGIVHRDIKPENIIVLDSEYSAKILDFGLAALVEPDASNQSLTKTGMITGTPAYMSPERCRGEKATPASDVYSLGCVMYECLFRRKPFAADTALGVMSKHLNEEISIPSSPWLPKQLKDILSKCLRKEPALRYTSACQLHAALANTNVENGMPLAASVAIALAAVAVVGAVATFFLNTHAPKNSKRQASVAGVKSVHQKKPLQYSKVSINRLKTLMEEARDNEDLDQLRGAGLEMISRNTAKLSNATNNLTRDELAKVAADTIEAYCDLAGRSNSDAERDVFIRKAIKIGEKYLNGKGQVCTYAYTLAAEFATTPATRKLASTRAVDSCQDPGSTLDQTTKAAERLLHEDNDATTAAKFIKKAGYVLKEEPTQENQAKLARVSVEYAFTVGPRSLYKSEKEKLLQAAANSKDHYLYANLCHDVCQFVMDSDANEAVLWNAEALNHAREAEKLEHIPKIRNQKRMILYQSGDIYRVNKDWDALLRIAKEGLATEGGSSIDTSRFMSMEGLALCKKGQFQQSISILKEALSHLNSGHEDASTHVDILNNLVQACDQSGDRDGVRQYAGELRELVKQNRESLSGYDDIANELLQKWK